MVKAVIEVGGKQYIVAEKENVFVDLMPDNKEELNFDALAIIDGEKTKVGKPVVDDIKVACHIVENNVKGDKIRTIRYHSKKRVHTENGHRQQYTEIQIDSIK